MCITTIIREDIFDEMDISYTAFMANITTFNIAKGFSAELSGFYRSKTIDQLIVMNEMYQMTIGLQKVYLKIKELFVLTSVIPLAGKNLVGV